MPFSLIADLPLGTYRGHVGGGGADALPSPARLHAALLCAAAQGTRAVPDGDLLGPSAEDAAALSWLEAHPPDGLLVPRTEANAGLLIAYRKEGVIPKESQRWTDKVSAKPTGASVAVDGPIGWTWHADPPAEVRDSIGALCSDVSHLGMAESPVRLRVGEIAPTHRRDPDADLFSGPGLDLDTATAGRSAALSAAHRAANGKPPPISQDAHKASEKSLRPPIVTASMSQARYVGLVTEPPPAPWTTAILLGLDRGIDKHERVRWCVAAHRALVSLVGDGAPAVLTGVYESAGSRPANRLALQIVNATDARVTAPQELVTPAALLILVPEGVGSSELATLGEAIRYLRVITRGPKWFLKVVGRPVALPTHEFWRPVPAGHRRWWRTVPAAVPDTRPLRGGPWTMTDAVRLSAGLVWRDLIAAPGRGDRWYRDLAATSAAHGVEVAEMTRIRGGDLARYVHRVHEGTVVQPYEATVSLGDLAGERTVAAIGQSRHLGGGLLLPYDVPEGEGD